MNGPLVFLYCFLLSFPLSFHNSDGVYRLFFPRKHCTLLTTLEVELEVEQTNPKKQTQNLKVFRRSMLPDPVAHAKPLKIVKIISNYEL